MVVALGLCAFYAPTWRAVARTGATWVRQSPERAQHHATTSGRASSGQATGRTVANDLVRSCRLVVPALWSATAIGPPVGQGNDSRPLVVDVYDCSVLGARAG